METTKLNKEQRISKELNKLKRQFKGIDENRKGLAEKSMENAAWMSVTLEDLRETIDAAGPEGLVAVYQNGENQYGTKKSPEVEIYNQTLKNYMQIIKQLTDMLPEAVKISKDDKDAKAIGEFIHK